MQATCPRCGSAHQAWTDGLAIPCALCGYTALLVSARPPTANDGEPARWAVALAGCVAVSGLVLVCALVLTHLAGEAASASAHDILGASAQAGGFQPTVPACQDPSLWVPAGP